MTLSFSDETKKRLGRHGSVKWSAVVRSVIEQKLDDFEQAEAMAAKSRLSPEDFTQISAKVSAAASRHAKRLLHESRS